MLKEDVPVLLLWRPLTFLVKREIWTVVVIFLGKTSWISLRTCLIVSLFSCELVRVVPDVTHVLVSPSSVVTEMCEVSTMCSDWEFCGTAVLFFPPQKVFTLVQLRRKM